MIIGSLALLFAVYVVCRWPTCTSFCKHIP